MPLYEYQCEKCKTRFEHLARSSADAPPKCPQCGHKKPARQLSTFSATVSSGSSLPSCATGSCSPAPSCATGACPFA